MPIKELNNNLPLLDKARRNISRFVVAQARMRQERVGFGWRPAVMAPSNYTALTAEFKACQVSGWPMRVSDQHNEPTIYEHPNHNLIFRYWHDTSHVIHGLNFEADDELELAGHHLEALRAEGYGPHTMEHQLLHADTFGQAYFQLVTGRFVENQVRFDTNCLLFGVEEAVAQELDALGVDR